jgi:hypothetical protein
MLSAALTVRFLLELALLAGSVAWAWLSFSGGLRWVVAIAAPVLIAVTWGMFLSPRAAVPLPEWARFTIEAVLFGGVFVGLVFVGLAVWGAIGLVVWLVDKVVLLVLGQ